MIPTSTNISIDVAAKSPSKAEAVAIFLHRQADAKHPEVQRIPSAQRKIVARLLEAKAFGGKSNELTTQFIEHNPGGRLLMVGLGDIKAFSCDCLREAGGVIARTARKLKLKRVALIVPPVPATLPGLPNGESAGAGAEKMAAALATGLMLASFDWTEYKGKASKKKDKEPGPISYTLIVPDADVKIARQAVQRAVVIAEGQNFARTIATRPGNEINPPALAEVARQLAKEVGLNCRILDEKEMKRLGMGGILAVGAGSNRTPPRMIVLEHQIKNQKSKIKNPLLVVGKAITFDTGGISIKPAEHMGKMVFDKCGAMAVLGLMYAAAKLKLPVNLVGILASAENHISETAYRPGDLLRMYNGVTVEVTNTDAEGRLVLGDALSWGIETYKPAAVVDLATLTGGCVVALGHIWAGLMSNNDELAREIAHSADDAGEKVWRLPIGEEVREMIKSDFADIINAAGRWASPLTAGAFLSYFIPEDGKTPWVHLDIAGVADTDKELPYYGKGATGWGVRTLVNWVTSRTQK